MTKLLGRRWAIALLAALALMLAFGYPCSEQVDHQAAHAAGQAPEPEPVPDEPTDGTSPHCAETGSPETALPAQPEDVIAASLPIAPVPLSYLTEPAGIAPYRSIEGPSPPQVLCRLRI
ncbi:MAG: hypothetical protein HOV83_33265 [Catenulispora sp.]|nr:hypothetical protein [Catenulispora sp.]